MSAFLRKNKSLALGKRAASQHNQTPVPASHPPQQPGGATYPPPPPDASGNMPAAVDAAPPPPPPDALQRRSSAPTGGGNPAGLMHSIKLATKGDAAKKTIAADASLTAADRAVESLLATFPQVANAVDANNSAFIMLAESQRNVRGLVTQIYLEDDAALEVLSAVDEASAALTSLDTAPNSLVAAARAETAGVLKSLIARSVELQKMHMTRVSTTRERNYYADKVRTLQASSSTKPKEQEKRARNQQKLQELTFSLDSLTNAFHAELDSLFEARGFVADKVVKSFSLSNAAVLVAFAPVEQRRSAALIGDRATPPTGPAPEAPPAGVTPELLYGTQQELYTTASSGGSGTFPGGMPGVGVAPPPPPDSGFPAPPPGGFAPPLQATDAFNPYAGPANSPSDPFGSPTPQTGTAPAPAAGDRSHEQQRQPAAAAPPPHAPHDAGLGSSQPPPPPPPEGSAPPAPYAPGYGAPPNQGQPRAPSPGGDAASKYIS